MKMPWEDGISLIFKAFKNDLKDKYFKMYVLERLFMKEPMSFEEYYKNNTRNVKRESKKEILNKVNNILKNALRKGGEK